jgi:cell division septum initiation protein DivIVA
LVPTTLPRYDLVLETTLACNGSLDLHNVLDNATLAKIRVHDRALANKELTHKGHNARVKRTLEAVGFFPGPPVATTAAPTTAAPTAAPTATTTSPPTTEAPTAPPTPSADELLNECISHIAECNDEKAELEAQVEDLTEQLETLRTRLNSILSLAGVAAPPPPADAVATKTKKKSSMSTATNKKAHVKTLKTPHSADQGAEGGASDANTADAAAAAAADAPLAHERHKRGASDGTATQSPSPTSASASAAPPRSKGSRRAHNVETTATGKVEKDETPHTLQHAGGAPVKHDSAAADRGEDAGGDGRAAHSTGSRHASAKKKRSAAKASHSTTSHATHADAGDEKLSDTTGATTTHKPPSGMHKSTAGIPSKDGVSPKSSRRRRLTAAPPHDEE